MRGKVAFPFLVVSYFLSSVNHHRSDEKPFRHQRHNSGPGGEPYLLPFLFLAAPLHIPPSRLRFFFPTSSRSPRSPAAPAVIFGSPPACALTCRLQRLSHRPPSIHYPSLAHRLSKRHCRRRRPRRHVAPPLNNPPPPPGVPTAPPFAPTTDNGAFDPRQPRTKTLTQFWCGGGGRRRRHRRDQKDD